MISNTDHVHADAEKYAFTQGQFIAGNSLSKKGFNWACSQLSVSYGFHLLAIATFG